MKAQKKSPSRNWQDVKCYTHIGWNVRYVFYMVHHYHVSLVFPIRPTSQDSFSSTLHFSIDEQDVDVYKTTVRENIQAWFNQLKFAECPDWLVILVETADSKKNNKILPRTTVLDKIKNDFGGKTTERYTQQAKKK